MPPEVHRTARGPLPLRLPAEELAARTGGHVVQRGLRRPEEARVEAEWSAHLGERRMRRLREALREVTDPYAAPGSQRRRRHDSLGMTIHSAM